MESKLFPYYSSHDNFDSGFGRKVHIGDLDGTICGTKHWAMTSSIDVEIDHIWAKTAMVDNNLCRKCFAKYIKILKQELKNLENEQPKTITAGVGGEI